MEPEVAMFEHLSANVNLVTLTGGRIYAIRWPQKPTPPAVLVRLTTDPIFYHLRGGSRLNRSGITIDCLAAEASGLDPYALALQVGGIVDDAVSGTIWSAGSPVQIQITGSFRRDRVPYYDPDELRQVHVVYDYIVWYKKAA